MVRLPLLEDDHLDAASRLRFLTNFASRAGDLVAEIAPSSDHALPAEAALTEAAALAFAIDGTRAGKELLSRVLTKRETEQPPFLRYLMITAVLQSGVGALRPDGVLLVGTREATIYPWSAPARILQASAGAILTATLASGISQGNFVLLHRSTIPSEAGRLAQVAIATCPEAATLPLFGLSVDDDGLLKDARVTELEQAAAFTSFLALHDRYAAALRLNRADRERWNDLRCRAPLIDWPLLLLHLALRRHNTMVHPIDENRSDLAGRLAVFLHHLAGEIDDSTTDANRGGPAGGRGPGRGGLPRKFGPEMQSPFPTIRPGVAEAN